MKPTLFLSVVAGILLVLPVSQVAWGKAHVPLDRLQVCTADGKVKTIKESKLAKELAKGGCRLPVCAFDGSKTNIYVSGSTCTAAPARGFCEFANTPAEIAAEMLSAVDVTASCTIQY